MNRQLRRARTIGGVVLCALTGALLSSAFGIATSEASPPASSPLVSSSDTTLASTTSASPSRAATSTSIAFVRDSQIWIANADGSGQRQLVGGDGNDFDPSWSPDGSRLAYLHVTTDGQLGFVPAEIRLVAVDGTGVHSLSVSLKGRLLRSARYNRVCWSADGKSLFASLVGASWKTSLLQINVRTGRASALWSASEITAEVVSCRPRHKELLLAISGPDVIRLFRFRLADRKLIALKSRMVDEPDGAWSRDGKTLAVCRAPLNARLSFDSMRLVLTGPTGITKRRLDRTLVEGSSYGFSHPSWSADGSLLAYALTAYESDPVVRVCNVASGTVSTLIENAEQPDWRP